MTHREKLPGEVLCPDGVHSAYKCELCEKFDDIFGGEFYRLGTAEAARVCHRCMISAVMVAVNARRRYHRLMADRNKRLGLGG